MKLLRDESGTSILTALVVLSAIMAVSYATLEAEVAVAKTHRNSVTVGEINTYFGRIRGIIETQWSCTASLAGLDFTGPIMLKDPVDAGTIIAQAGTAVGTFGRVSQLEITNVKAVASRPGVLSADLIIDFAKDMRFQTGEIGRAHV